jgi:hypothetical protein
MDESLINGRYFGSHTTAVKNEQGDWEVTVTMEEKRRYKGQDWEVKTISTLCTNDTFEEAYSVAMTSTIEKFKDIIEKTKSDSLFSVEEPAVQ